MTPATKAALEDYAGRNLVGRVHGPIKIGTEALPSNFRGVYMVFDQNDVCAYVGKVASDLVSNRLVSRLQTHLRDLRKREVFSTIFLLEMDPRSTNLRVEIVEGWVARHLRPYLSDRHPNPYSRLKPR